MRLPNREHELTVLMPDRNAFYDRSYAYVSQAQAHDSYSDQRQFLTQVPT